MLETQTKRKLVAASGASGFRLLRQITGRGKGGLSRSGLALYGVLGELPRTNGRELVGWENDGSILEGK